jgi:hypothetical protein
MADNPKDVDRVIPLADWYRRIGLPERSGRRLIESGQGPTITRLTERRKGVRERDHLAWLEARRMSTTT